MKLIKDPAVLKALPNWLNAERTLVSNARTQALYNQVLDFHVESIKDNKPVSAADRARNLDKFLGVPTFTTASRQQLWLFGSEPLFVLVLNNSQKLQIMVSPSAPPDASQAALEQVLIYLLEGTKPQAPKIFPTAPVAVAVEDLALDDES